MFCSDDEHRLHKELFANYNKIIRPVENVSDPVMVWFEVSLSQLVKVVSKLETFLFYLSQNFNLVKHPEYFFLPHFLPSLIDNSAISLECLIQVLTVGCSRSDAQPSFI